MNLELSEEQSILADTFEKLFATESTPSRIRACEPLGFDPALWAQLADMRAPLLRVSEAGGGIDASLFDAVLVAEAAGRHVASIPLVESIVANRLLDCAGGSIGRHWLARAVSGAIVTLALEPAESAGRLLVPGGAVADAVLFLSGDRLCLAVQREKPPATKNLGSLPLAALDLPGSDFAVLSEGANARQSYLAAIEEWKLLSAANLAALARKSLEDAAEYSCERIAFDRPIGSYQGLAHPLADSVTDVDGARLLAWWAVWSIAQKTPDAGILPSAAFWWAGEASKTATRRAIRVFGGYGVSMEHPAQLYHRRGKSLALLAGNPIDLLRRIASWLLDGEAKPPLPAAGEIHIDMGMGEPAHAYATQARSFLEENLTPAVRARAAKHSDGFDAGFHKKLAGAGFMYPDWPKSMGGQGRSGYEASALLTVYGEQGWYMMVSGVTAMVSQMIMMFGTEEAKSEMMPKVLAGEVNFALGYSEPSCGSDIFAAKTKAVRSGEDWIINGQKIFTSQGHLAQYALMVTRTNPDVPKHAGLTLFVVPLDQPGYTYTEIATLGGERTNTTFYVDMKVPDKYRLGAIDGGVKVLAAVLALEQSGGEFFAAALQRLYRHAEIWGRAAKLDGRPAVENDDFGLAFARLKIRIEVMEGLSRRVLWSNAMKSPQKYFGPMVKLFGSEAIGPSADAFLELAAPWSVEEAETDLSVFVEEARRSVAGTIYAGTSEIQRSIIAEAALGMPRTRS